MLVLAVVAVMWFVRYSGRVRVVGVDPSGGHGFVRWYAVEDGEVKINPGKDDEMRVALDARYAVPTPTGPLYIVCLEKGDLLKVVRDERTLLERADAKVYAALMANADVRIATRGEKQEWWEAAMPYAVVAIFLIVGVASAILYIVGKAYEVF